MVQHTGQDAEPLLRYAMASDLMEGMPQLCEDIEARPQDPNQPTMEFAEELTTSETPEEALAVCAYALPARRGVWWGHECLMRVQDALTPRDTEFLQMAQEWVADPTEERRVTLVEAAYPGEQPPLPGQWIALGAAWADGSMNPPDMPDVPAAPHLSPTALHVGVLTALAVVDIESREATLGSFVKMARQLTQ